VCQALNIIILCHIKYLDYFWCIKYQYINIYVKMGKENGKNKRKRIFLANWARGVGGFGPAGARARGHAGRRPNLARQRERHGDGAVGAGPHASEGRGNSVRGVTGGVRPRGKPVVGA
jgi:hypothetical protein